MLLVRVGAFVDGSADATFDWQWWHGDIRCIHQLVDATTTNLASGARLCGMGDGHVQCFAEIFFTYFAMIKMKQKTQRCNSKNRDNRLFF